MEFRMLGPLELWHEGQRIEIGAAKQRALLALLLLDVNQPVGQDRLIDALWDGDAPQSAISTLHSYVYRLRKLFTGTDVSLWRRPTGYVLETRPDTVDLYEFERLAAEGRTALEQGDHDVAAETLRAGLELWHGNALVGIDLMAVRDRAGRLDEQRLDATEWYLTAELELGRHDAMISELETLTAAHPLRERLWELSMLALYRCGRQAEALEAYQKLYRALDELGIETSRTARELQQRILTGDSTLAPPAIRTAVPKDVRTPVQKGERGRSGHPAVVPRQLPAGIGDFTGRAEALSRLDALLEPTTPVRPLAPEPRAVVISAITGTAGIGKTTLAVHWAHRVSDRFPDGQLYVNLHGFDPSMPPTTPAEAIRGFLDALGVPPTRIPVDPESQTGLYRSLLADRQLLVVVDNARDEEQVRPLLPGSAGCLVVVTSRDQLSGLVAADGAHPVQVDLLTTAEARDLLTARLGKQRVHAEPDAVDGIIESCARLPLALTIVAARAATHPTFPLATFATELRDARATLDAFASDDPSTDVRTVLSWSYRRLGAEAARLFRLLGLHPGPDISAAAAASLAGVSPSAARVQLSQLTRSHLAIEYAPGRYTLHDLLRAHASELSQSYETDAERSAALSRILDHYLHTAFAASRLFNPLRNPIPVPAPSPDVVPEGLGTYDDALGWFTTERPVLLNTIGLVNAARFDTRISALAWSLNNFFDRQGHWHDQITANLAALDAADRRSDRPSQARARRSLGRANVQLGRYDEANAQLSRALDIHDELEDHLGQVNTLQDLAWVAAERGDYRTALDQLHQVRTGYQLEDYPIARGEALNGMGWCHAMLGEYEPAIAYCRQALEVQQDIGDQYGAAVTWKDLGEIQQRLGAYAEAVDCHRHALELHRDLGNRYHEAGALTHLGDALNGTGDHTAARDAWQQALVILEGLNHSDAEKVRAKLTAE